jgi:XTP/dITP diphosphohydrolase
MQILLATGNPGKVRELSNMLADYGVEVIAQSQFNVPEVPETGTTFVENAIIKARHAAELTGLPAIADDSGIEVEALNGAPGIYSARYAGTDASDEDNLNKLIEAAKALPENKRQARYRCVLVYMRHAKDPSPIICDASWYGSLVTTPAGENGFGYDPIFYVQEDNCTSAELSIERKDQLSHRGKALRELVTQLKEHNII